MATIVALLADDHLGRGRERVEDPSPAAYFDAFARIDADPRNLLMVAEDPAGVVVGCFQMTFIPGLSNVGAELALIEGVRVASHLRGGGYGRQLIAWALDEARRRGCASAELLSHLSREGARRFYRGLGFEESHAGLKISLDGAAGG